MTYREIVIPTEVNGAFIHNPAGRRIQAAANAGAGHQLGYAEKFMMLREAVVKENDALGEKPISEEQTRAMLAGFEKFPEQFSVFIKFPSLLTLLKLCAADRDELAGKFIVSEPINAIWFNGYFEYFAKFCEEKNADLKMLTLLSDENLSLLGSHLFLFFTSYLRKKDAHALEQELFQLLDFLSIPMLLRFSTTDLNVFVKNKVTLKYR